MQLVAVEFVVAAESVAVESAVVVFVVVAVEFAVVAEFVVLAVVEFVVVVAVVEFAVAFEEEGFESLVAALAVGVVVAVVGRD